MQNMIMQSLQSEWHVRAAKNEVCTIMKGEHKPTFLDNVILDVTNFEAMSPDEPVGYLCSCSVSVFPDGRIMFHENDECLKVFLSKT